MAWHASGRAGAGGQEDRKKSDQSSRSEKRKISRCSLARSFLPPSVPPPPTSIRTSSPSSLNSGRQRVIYCGERERERERGLQRPASVRPPGGLRYSSSGSSYFAAPQPPPPPPPPPPPNSVYCSRSYKWHPLSPHSPRRSTAQHREGGREGERAAGRQNWPNTSAVEWEKEGKGSPSVRLSLSLFLRIVLEWLLAASAH